MSVRRTSRFSIALVLVALALSVPPLFAGVTTCVSVASDGTQGNSLSYVPSISADGRYVAFESFASNLVPGDTNGKGDIFVRDRQTGQTTRVSVASDGTQGNSRSYNPSISADGRYVAFYSLASNLVPGDTNGNYDVFVRDRQTGQTTRVSVASDGTQGNYDSYNPSISADGRYVAFSSYASNLVPGDTNGNGHIFVRDRQTGQTTRVSVASDGAQGNSISYVPSISADGRYVAFDSDASNLVPGDTHGVTDVFVRDRQTGQTTRVSVASDGTQCNDHSYYPSISADGRYVAFESYGANLVSGDTFGSLEVFVHDRQTGQTTRVSVASNGAQGNWYSYDPSISADGRYVAFESDASNLVPGGTTNGATHVFVRDRQTGQTTLVSVASDGWLIYRQSAWPSISADGRYVAFGSDDSNLVYGDRNGTYDVFVRDQWGGGTPPGVSISDFTLTPGILGSGANVTARVTATGAARASLRIHGLRRDQPPIPMQWDGSAWTVQINGSLASWAQGGSLLVWADAFDSQGQSASVCRSLSVNTAICPVSSGAPNAVWVDETNGCGILTGSASVLTTGPPLTARLSMDTVVTSFLGVDGPMNLWPSVTASGVPMHPATDQSMGAVFAQWNRFTPSGGPRYDATFTNVGDQATFVANMDLTAFKLTLQDTALTAVSTLYPGVPDLSPATLLQVSDAFGNLAPVARAAQRFKPWPSSGAAISKAVALSAWDLSELITNGYEREALRQVLEAALREATNNPKLVVKDPSWLSKVGTALSYYQLMKICRDMWIWGLSTWDNTPSLAFQAYRTGAGNLAMRATSSGGGSGLVRPPGTDIGYSVSHPLTGSTAYNFAVSNTAGSPLWEFRVELDETQPQPTSATAPPNWKSEIVWEMSDRYVRWYTEGPSGWSSGDYGSSVLSQGGSLSGFSFTSPSPLDHCAYSVTDTDMKVDGGALPMTPGLAAMPPDFTPGAGQTTTLAAYLERPATAAIKVYKDDVECATIAGLASHPAGEFTCTWDGTKADGQEAEAGSYDARLLITYNDGDTAEVTTPLTVLAGGAPSVSITSPDDGATISGLFTITGECTAEVGVVNVRLLVDDSPVGYAEVSGSSWAYFLDTSTYGTGGRTLTAIVEDGAGRTASASVSVNVFAGTIRGLSSGTVTFGGIVTAEFADCMFVEADDRSIGVRVTESPSDVSVGDYVLVTGEVSLVGGMKQIAPTEPIYVYNSDNPLPELGMRCRDVGGHDYGPNDPGITYGRGPLNVGLYVTIQGTVTYCDTTGAYPAFYVWDGTNMRKPMEDTKPLYDDNPGGYIGLRVAHNGWLGAPYNRALLQHQDFVTIKGIVGLDDTTVPGQVIPVILPISITPETAFDNMASAAGGALNYTVDYGGINLMAIPGVPGRVGTGEVPDPIGGVNPYPWDPTVVLAGADQDIAWSGEASLFRWENANSSQCRYDIWESDLFGGMNPSDGYWMYLLLKPWALNISGKFCEIPQWYAVENAGVVWVGQPHPTLTQLEDIQMTDGGTVYSFRDASQIDGGLQLNWVLSTGFWWNNQDGSQYDVGLWDDWPYNDVTYMSPWHGYLFTMQEGQKAWIIP